MKRTICIYLATVLSAIFLYGGNTRLKIVVIDPGHGGKDPGAVSADGKTYEKNITLDIAKRLSSKITNGTKDVKVLMTRESDKFVSLNDRALIANNAGADLFISIHINAAENRNANGYSIHLMGQSLQKNKDLYEYNLNVCRRENAVIKLEDDYTTTYEGFDPDDAESVIFMQLMQNAHLEQSMSFAEIIEGKMKSSPFEADRGVWQNPFYVLWKTAMPSALLELGFISNKNDLAVLRDENNREKIAECLYHAFVEYKQHYDRSLGNDIEEEKADSVTSQEGKVAIEENKIKYGVQIFAGSNLLPERSPEFMGYKVKILQNGKIYRYIIGISSSMEEARKEQEVIRKKYPSCYIVEVKED